MWLKGAREQANKMKIQWITFRASILDQVAEPFLRPILTALGLAQCSETCVPGHFRIFSYDVFVFPDDKITYKYEKYRNYKVKSQKIIIIKHSVIEIAPKYCMF